MPDLPSSPRERFPLQSIIVSIFFSLGASMAVLSIIILILYLLTTKAINYQYDIVDKNLTNF